MEYEEVRKKLEKTDKFELIDIIITYDKYIQEANDENKYIDGWKPTLLSEFILS